MPSFHVGDAVHVDGFGKGIVREARNGGRYLVEVKGRAMAVGADQLTLLAVPPRAVPAAPVPAARPDVTRDGDGAIARVDLHGHTVETALAALDEALNDALLAGAAELHVIHGRSGGRLRAAVHRRLTALPPVRRFGLDPRNPGVTIVRL